MTPLKLERTRQLKNLLVLLRGTVGAQLLALAAMPVVTRLYTPAEFGLLGTFVALLSGVLIVSTLSYELAIPVEPDDKNAHSLVAIGMVLSVASGLVFAALFIVFRENVSIALNTPELSVYFWILPLSVVAGSVVKTLTYLAIRNKNYRGISTSKISQSVLQVAMQISLGLMKMPGGLIISDAISRSGGGFALWRAGASPHGREGMFDVSVMRALIRKYKRYALLTTPSALLHSAGTVVPPLLVAWLYGPVQAGFFALTQRVVWGPFSLLGQSIAQLFLAETSKLATSEPAKLWQATKHTTASLFAVGLIPAVVVALFGEKLISLIFGQTWGMAGEMAEILIVGYFMQFVVGPVFQLLNVLSRQAWLLCCDFIGLALVVSAFGIGRVFQFAVGQTLLLYTCSVAIMYALLLIVTTIAVRRHAVAKVHRDPS